VHKKFFTSHLGKRGHTKNNKFDDKMAEQQSDHALNEGLTLKRKRVYTRRLISLVEKSGRGQNSDQKNGAKSGAEKRKTNKPENRQRI